MQRIKVDTTDLAFTVAEAPQPVTDYTTKAAVTDENGVQIYTVRLLITSADGMEINAVKFPSKPVPSFTVGQSVTVSGLLATPYVANGTTRASVALRAASVEADRAINKAAAS